MKIKDVMAMSDETLNNTAAKMIGWIRLDSGYGEYWSHPKFKTLEPPKYCSNQDSARQLEEFLIGLPSDHLWTTYDGLLISILEQKHGEEAFTKTLYHATGRSKTEAFVLCLSSP